MLSIVVTGGAGYLGSVMVPYLLAAGHKVTVVDNFRFDQAPFNHLCLDEAFDVVKGDARDVFLMRPLLAKADVFIPLAAIVGAPACNRDRAAATTTNVGAIAMALGIMSPEQAVLVPITNSGYGIGGSGECTEDSPLNPISLYGTTKVEAEKLVMERGNAISFRLATVFGMSPRMRLDLLVNDFVHRAMTDKALVLFEGHFRRNYIHVRDVAAAFLHGVSNFTFMRGKPYNVGLSDANLTKIELCEVIKSHIPEFTYVESNIGEDPDKRDYVVSNKRIEATGFKPAYSLSAGIRELMKGLPMLRTRLHANV